jgi:hypothetical protein
VGAWIGHCDRRAFRRAAGALTVAAAICAAPITLYSLLERGTLAYSGQTYLYSVYKDPEVMELGFGGPLPTASEFIMANPGLVAGAVAETLWSYARLLFFEWELLLPLLPACALVILTLLRRRYERAALVVLAVASSNFLFYGLTWSTFQDRYMLLTLLLLLPFAVDAGARLGLDRARLPGPLPISPLVVAVLAVVAIWSPIHVRELRGEYRYGELAAPVRSDEGLRWTGPPRWVRDGEVVRVASWVSSRTDRFDVLAHAQPWPFTFFSGRPAVLLPRTLTTDRLRDFIVEYRVAYLLLDVRDRDRRHYQDWLDELEADGVTATTLGAHRVYDTRPLWR